jgi:hypothetical protein
VSGGDDSTVSLGISAVTPTEFEVVLTAEDETPDRYRAHAASLDGVALANVQAIDESGTPGKWTLARYTLHRPDLMGIEMAREDALKDPRAGSNVRDLARKHLRAGDLFEPFCACVRAAPSRSADAHATRTAGSMLPR